MSIFKRGTVIPVAPTPQLPEPVVLPDPLPHFGDYAKQFAGMTIRPEWLTAAEFGARKIISSKARYQSVEKVTGTPWHVVGLIHLMESDCDFRTHLHNGDSLLKRTVHVPAGRPVKGSPPFGWEESAVDAIQYDHVLPPLNTIDQQLYALEKFNGLGARKRGAMSAYLWSGSNLYLKGKYVRDGVWDANAVSKQVGCCPVLKVLIDQGHVKI